MTRRFTGFIAAPVLALAMMGCAAPAMAGEVDTDVDTRARADFNSCVKPIYPKNALETRREGTVTIAYLVGADGKVQDSKVTGSSGHADLDESARWAISKCRFTPASKDGKPVTSWQDVKYVWSLN